MTIQALLLCTVLCGSDLYESHKYQVYDNRIENKQEEVVAELERYELYTTDIIHSKSYNGKSYDDGRRLRLYSKMGFMLENIPLYHNRFYNECILIFLEIEQKIPEAQKCLKANGQKVVELSGLKFSFPHKPGVKDRDRKGRSNHTYFSLGNLEDCNKDEPLLPGPFDLLGYYDNRKEIIYVTLSPDYYQSIPVHEYIHRCGFYHSCDRNPEYEDRTFKCANKGRQELIYLPW